MRLEAKIPALKQVSFSLPCHPDLGSKEAGCCSVVRQVLSERGGPVGEDGRETTHLARELQGVKRPCVRRVCFPHSEQELQRGGTSGRKAKSQVHSEQMFLEDSGREEKLKASKMDPCKEPGLVHQAGGRSLQSDLPRALVHP